MGMEAGANVKLEGMPEAGLRGGGGGWGRAGLFVGRAGVRRA